MDCILELRMKPKRLNKPTMPILRLLPGRPKRVFFSWTGAFFGGIFDLFLANQMEVVEKDLVAMKVCDNRFQPLKFNRRCDIEKPKK